MPTVKRMLIGVGITVLALAIVFYLANWNVVVANWNVVADNFARGFGDGFNAGMEGTSVAPEDRASTAVVGLVITAAIVVGALLIYRRRRS
jgi:hypothetical protein